MQVSVMCWPLVGRQLADTCWWDHKVQDYGLHMQSQTADTNQLIFLHLELNLCSHTSKVL